MTKQQRCIIKAVTTVFFQQGFNAIDKTHSLDYWEYSTEEVLSSECWRRSNIVNGYCINTLKEGDQWYLRLIRIIDISDEYDEAARPLKDILLCIPIDPERLCWDEAMNCCTLIDYIMNGYEQLEN